MAGPTQVPVFFFYLFVYGAFTLCCWTFHSILLKFPKYCNRPYNPDDKSSVWALPLSLAATEGISSRFIFLRLLRCVTSAGIASLSYLFRLKIMRFYSHWVPPFGHLRINALTNSPKLIAGVHVLLRLLMPRHPSAALSSLIT